MPAESMAIRSRSTSILRRRQRLPMLSTALFGPSALGYTRRRLLFPTIRTAMMAFFHALEAAALVLIFDSSFLLPIISLRLLSSLASAGIWGATEALRQDVRALPARGGHEPLIRRVEEALSRATLIAILLLAGSVFWVWRFPQIAHGYFSVIDAYLLALAFRISLSWVSRTFHSGLLAKRRVYRPKWSLLLPDIFDGMGLFIFWRILGPWSIAVAVVGSTLLHSALAYYYSKRGYTDARVPVPRLFRLGRLGLPTPSLAKRWILSVSIGLACELPSLFVLGQWHSLAGSADLTAAMMLYWARPFASFLSSIPRIYYIDLVRAGELGGIVSSRLGRSITKTILVLGGLLTLGCTAFALVFATRAGALALFLYLAASSALALLTLRALGFMIVGYAPHKAEDRPTLVRFLETTRSSSRACDVLLFELETRQAPRTAHALIDLISQLEGASACRLGRRHILVASTVARDRREWLLSCAGTARVVASSPWATSGGLALRALYQSAQFPATLRVLLAGPSDIEGLRSLLLAKAPDAQVMTAGNRLRSTQKPGSMGDLRFAMRQYQGSFPPAALCWGQGEELLLVLAGGRPNWLVVIASDTPAAIAADLRRQTWNLGIRQAWGVGDGLCGDANPTTLKTEKEA